MKKNIENQDFNLIYDINIEEFAEDLFKEINLRKKKIIEFFELEEIRKIEIILFNNREEFINNIKSYYSSVNDIPSYCKANICNGKINILFDEQIKSYEYRYKLKIRNAIHEYIHVIYNEYISPDYRVLWLDEGLAINLSDERLYLNDEKKFKEFLIKIKPSLNKFRLDDLKHGVKFVNNEYNGYDISYIMVRYILENYNNKELNILIRNRFEIQKLEEKIMDEIIDYFYRNV